MAGTDAQTDWEDSVQRNVEGLTLAAAGKRPGSISTPVGQIRAKKRWKSDGSVTFMVQGIQVTFLRDRTAEPGEVERTGTHLEVVDPGRTPEWKTDASGKISKLGKLIPPSFTIRTVYKAGETRSDPSDYGRGRLPSDIKVGNGTLGFHEGCHGLDYVRYLQTKPLPLFQGKVGMTKAQYETAAEAYFGALEKYLADMKYDSIQRTDCVGIPGGDCL